MSLKRKIEARLRQLRAAHDADEKIAAQNRKHRRIEALAKVGLLLLLAAAEWWLPPLARICAGSFLLINAVLIVRWAEDQIEPLSGGFYIYPSKPWSRR